MRKYLTGSDLFAQIQMHRQVDSRAIIVVEGADDCGVVDPHLNEQAVHSIPGYGKQSVVDAAVLFDDDSVDRILLLVDADLDRHLGRASALPSNLVLTEYHDLDADILFSCPSLLVSVLANFTDRTMHREHLQSAHKAPLDCIVDIAAVVGVVRYHSILHDLCLKMRDFPCAPIIEPYEKTGSAVTAVVELALIRSKRADQSLRPSAISTFMASLTDVRPYCSGHDLISVMASFVRERWGGNAGSNALASAFRAAVSCACWQRTRIYAELHRWGTALGLDVWTCA